MEKHYSPLPLALLFGLLGGLVSAVFTFTSGGGFLLALLAYSCGGALSLTGSAVLLSVRIPARREAQFGAREHA